MRWKPGFPLPYRHSHPPVKNVNDLYEETRSPGDRIADSVAAVVGSWRFIVIQSVILAFWVVLNVTAYIRHWDPYPFILMNLFLSMQAAYTAPIIMMSQNRMAAKDRIEAHNDYMLDVKAEEEARLILDHLEAQNEALRIIVERLGAVEGRNSGDSRGEGSDT